MNANEAADHLAALPLLDSVPREEIEWLLERGEVRGYGPGGVIRAAGTMTDELNLPLTGRVALYVQRAGSWRRILEVGAGYVLGVVPYSRMQTAPGNVVAEEDTLLFTLHQRHFADLIVECRAVTTALVHHMIDRSREFRTMQMHDERLLALGKLASGLAHELNNPASGASSGARSFASLLDEVERASMTLAAARLSESQLEAIDAFRAACTGDSPERSALDAADREDEFTLWFERHGIEPAAVEALASSCVSLGALDALAAALPAEVLGTAIGWVATGAVARDVAHQIRNATTRISDLVAAVKGFTFMDREGMPSEVDIARGLADTLAMLESKSSSKSVDVGIETSDDLPAVWGYGSEINQVWQALIDNAIDAVNAAGSVIVTASARGEAVVVRVADDGPGIPEENRSRIFDPFFTTKPVGGGAGLGLHQARRIVDLHHGDIDVTSKPGRTVFRVRLPVTGANGGQARERHGEE